MNFESPQRIINCIICGKGKITSSRITVKFCSKKCSQEYQRLRRLNLPIKKRKKKYYKKKARTYIKIQGPQKATFYRFAHTQEMWGSLATMRLSEPSRAICEYLASADLNAGGEETKEQEEKAKSVLDEINMV